MKLMDGQLIAILLCTFLNPSFTTMLRPRKCVEVEYFSLLESPSRIAHHLTHAANNIVQKSGKYWNHKQATLTLEALRWECEQVLDVEYDSRRVDVRELILEVYCLSAIQAANHGMTSIMYVRSV
jgi:hypothetical protein